MRSSSAAEPSGTDRKERETTWGGAITATEVCFGAPGFPYPPHDQATRPQETQFLYLSFP